ncbi:ribosome small subunit-dependent GTPase A [Desulfogranum japonicum]|uniref:ribosome small subunit-dependent GTPase A n=1 Tax=Desulfogranum japonicum TaxID=231447 RepID=UPI0006890864|nr:ribosome small subunit-dependent GTPase A [Desulfogranum japonicum]
MNSTDTINTLHNQNIPTSLQQVGWSSFFQNQLQNDSNDTSPARIIGVRKNTYLATLGHQEIPATLSGRLFNTSGLSFPAVGDWVLLRDTVITQIFMRKNALSRTASGGRDRKNNEAFSKQQVLAANLDMVFIVCGLDRDFNPRRIERYLTLVYNCALVPVIILTKCDLHHDPTILIQEVESVAFGVPVYPVAANDTATVSQLRALLSVGQTAALIGSSGAGKSTLINRLYGDEIQATSHVGSRVGKGRHTTTTRDLIVLPSGGMVIDNPGIREIALSLDTVGENSAFPDIEAAARLCRFANCSHNHEPGCNVLEQVANGQITLSRLQSYQKLQNELDYHHQRESKSASRLEKERWKAVSQQAKAIKKRKR